MNQNLNINIESETLALQHQAITSEVIKKIKEHQKVGFERFSNWIPVGSGNYEKMQDDGRYRENCNEYRGIVTCENHKIEPLTIKKKVIKRSKKHSNFEVFKILDYSSFISPF